VSGTSPEPQKSSKENAFQWHHCPTCGRMTWFYNAGCCYHSVFPRPVSLGGLPVVDEEEKERARSPLVPPKGATTIKRFCGHLSTFAFANPCMKCLTYLRGSLCEKCEEYRKPLPSCACQRAYLVTEEKVRKPCGYCQVPTEIWDLGLVTIGKWGFRFKRLGFDNDGKEIVEKKSILLTRRVEGCKACQGVLDILQRLEPEGRKAFLPER
jgi:hypothetical protein